MHHVETNPKITSSNMSAPPKKWGFCGGGVRVWIFSSIFVQSWWFKMKIYSTMINEFISHTVLHVRAPSRAPKIDEIEVSLKNVNFRPFSRHVYLIVKVTFKCIQWSVHEWNIHCVKYFHVGIKKFVRALWRARYLDEINIFSLKRFLYDCDKNKSHDN